MKTIYCLGLLLLLNSIGFGAREYDRTQDFRAAAGTSKGSHQHGSLLEEKSDRWSYYLLTSMEKKETENLGELLSEPSRRVPLKNFSKVHIGDQHFRHASYNASAEEVSLIWNNKQGQPESEWIMASLAVVFSPPATGTYSITGNLLWQNMTKYPMNGSASLEIGVLRSGNSILERLFLTKFKANSKLSKPILVDEFNGESVMKNMPLNQNDKIVFIWNSDSRNYRGLIGIDKNLRIVHAEGIPLPSDEEEIRKLTVYQNLFGLMNTNHPLVADAKKQLENSDYPSAMKMYMTSLAERVAALPKRNSFSYWLYGVANANRLLEGKLGTVRYGDTSIRYEIEIGQPGSCNFFMPVGETYRTSIRDISSMHWVTKHAEAYQKSKDPKFLKAWFATWDDFARNWSTQYQETRKDETIWGYDKEGQRGVRGIDWLNNQLYLAWRLESILDGLMTCLQTAHDAGHLEQIDPLQLARILVRTVTSEAEMSRHFFGKVQGLVPNQIRHLANSLYAWGLYFPEVRASEWWRNESFPILTATHNPDGTDHEHSLNYFGNNLLEILKIAHEAPKGMVDPELLEKLKEMSTYRDRVIPALKRPDGILCTVGKNNIWREYGEKIPFTPPSQAYTSIYFPYNGFSVQRDGWAPDSLYLFMRGSRPSRGHWRAQDGGLQLSAYGQNMLVSAVGYLYDKRNAPWNGYFYSATAQNTILVDGMGHNGRSEGLDKLDDYLWSTSDSIDFMETEMNRTYGGWDFRIDGSKSAAAGSRKDKVIDVQHRRQVHFLREMKCWIVTDRVDSEKEHDFTQTWCFDPKFKNAEIEMDIMNQKIYTTSSIAPNLFMHQFGAPTLTYEKYFGVYEDDKVLGWTGIMSDPDQWRYTPKTDTHVNWKGSGKQLLITLLAPSKEKNSPIASITKISNDSEQGFDAHLVDGSRISYRASAKPSKLTVTGVEATAKSLLLISDRTGKQKGMVLGAEKFMGNPASNQNQSFEIFAPGSKEFEFGKNVTVTPVMSPSLFGWKDTDLGPKPVYK